MAIHIETGHPVTKDAERIDAKSVRFVNDDYRTLFEVCIGRDGRSIEVRGIDVVSVDGALYGSYLAALPNAANSLTIALRHYD